MDTQSSDVDPLAFGCLLVRSAHGLAPLVGWSEICSDNRTSRSLAQSPKVVARNSYQLLLTQLLLTMLTRRLRNASLIRLIPSD